MQAIAKSVVILLCIVLLVGAAFSGILQFLALLRLANAHWGILGLGGALLFTWPAFGLPAMLYWTLIKNFPDAWKSESMSRLGKVSFTVAFLVLFALASQGVSWATGWGLSWFADLDCAKAFAAGVTGSHPCY